MDAASGMVLNQPVAAVVLMSRAGRVLMMRRTDGTGWAFPAGGVEAGESPEDAAWRECYEETGYRLGAVGKTIMRRVKEGVDCTTFLCPVDDEFVPQLNHEHDQWAWLEPKATAREGLQASLAAKKPGGGKGSGAGRNGRQRASQARGDAFARETFADAFDLEAKDARDDERTVSFVAEGEHVSFTARDDRRDGYGRQDYDPGQPRGQPENKGQWVAGAGTGAGTPAGARSGAREGGRERERGGSGNQGVPAAQGKPETAVPSREELKAEVERRGTTSAAKALSESELEAAVSGMYEAAEGYKPLPGLPQKIMSVGGEAFVLGPLGKAQKVAEAYMRSAGMTYRRPEAYVKVDPQRAARIANAFEDMKHAPDDPKVKASYDALAKETLAQWQAIKKTGLKVSWIEPGQEPPYLSPFEAERDVRENNHWWGFPTDQGFGSSEAEHAGNPMLEDADETVGGRKMCVNDIFRIVHDYFGHVKEGFGFRADGEDNAWRTHAAMYSDAARPAMTTETRGQNSWVNYGPHAEANLTASEGGMVYAPQKIGLLPDWAMEDIGGKARGDEANAIGWTDPDEEFEWQLNEPRAFVPNDAFDESEHPRGQPQNKGQFVEGGGSGGGKADKPKLDKDAWKKAGFTVERYDEKPLEDAWPKIFGDTTPEEVMHTMFKEPLPGDGETIYRVFVRSSETLKIHDISITARRGGGDDEGRTFIRRIFGVDEKGRLGVEHDYFSIPEAGEGKGYGKKFLRDSFELYKKMGVDNVHVHANINVGGYAWAKYGFVPTQKSWDQLRKAVYTGDVPKKYMPAVEAVLGSSDPKAIWALSDFKFASMSNTERFGKLALLGEDWEGNIDMTDQDAMRRFDAYVNKPSR
jgi:ADP-ribose pyrophosphatase YjhB (NUDIX family)